MLKVCLIGLGKTGREIAKMIFNQRSMKIIAVMCSPGSLRKHMDLGEVIGIQEIGIKIEGTNKLEETLVLCRPDVVVDFSTPEATLKNSRIISQMGINMIIGTTGFSEAELDKIKNLAYRNHTGIVYAPNITLGVNVLMILTKLASILLNNYDFQISEIHHKEKKDIPSGTALKIANEIKDGLVYLGKDISKENIPINSVRAGGVVGKHEVLIVGENDRITISHESFSRKVFASGAIHAINFIQDKIGFYEMSDVLSLSKVTKDLYALESNAKGNNFESLIATDIQ
ncbi:4-hydroxy-tetrahydrodipicolinate reductase [Clostridium chromiireducens]|uniref:4-hydroxy-tetrahydrodipicolinate reductase n=1 Tax=Clostridium chromiireducens TaxID=225345 RepID=A0A1V4IEP8_9CLOT|nr:4-hydroxy-tetrahydrodipicolinate reductase [Clostridium chromiireducens]OPJ58324.1 4-hydroxy-tetrahydrodipicolinate reductase [Clostridium chromiireducens]RII33503.1 4-hydroxy-tetrahydrodipicolinate reductase [Clostridium chromiireducens]